VVTHGTGPGSSYIPYLETGTRKMKARYMEGTTKITNKGYGMFTYVRGWLAGKVGDATKSMARDIEDKL
jgi:hypothetical protein